MVDFPITPEMAVHIAQAAPYFPPSGRAHLTPEARAELESKELADATARAQYAKAQQDARYNREEAEANIKIIMRTAERHAMGNINRHAFLVAADAHRLCWKFMRDESTAATWFAQLTGFPIDVAKRAVADAARGVDTSFTG
jgi:hypothetical protein